MIDRGVRNFLAGAPAVQALVGVRVYTKGMAPETAGRKFITVLTTGAEPRKHLRGVSLIRSTLEMQLVADSPALLTDMITAVRTAIPERGYRGACDQYADVVLRWEDQTDNTEPPNGDAAGLHTSTLFLAAWYTP
jgi:hypothetical protein